MIVNLENRSVSIDGEEVNLTAKEFDLPNYLLPIQERYQRENLLLKCMEI